MKVSRIVAVATLTVLVAGACSCSTLTRGDRGVFLLDPPQYDQKPARKQTVLKMDALHCLLEKNGFSQKSVETANSGFGATIIYKHPVRPEFYRVHAVTTPEGILSTSLEDGGWIGYSVHSLDQADPSHREWEPINFAKFRVGLFGKND